MIIHAAEGIDHSPCEQSLNLCLFISRLPANHLRPDQLGKDLLYLTKTNAVFSMVLYRYQNKLCAAAVRV